MHYHIHSRRTKRNFLHVHSFLKNTTITTFYVIFEIDYWWILYYGVAMIRRLLKMIGLFCKSAQWKRRYSVKETCNCKEPTNCSHPIRYPQCAIKKKKCTSPTLFFAKHYNIYNVPDVWESLCTSCLKMTTGGYCSVCVSHMWSSLSHLMMYITPNVFWYLKMTTDGYCSMCGSHMWWSLSHSMMFITINDVYHAQRFFIFENDSWWTL